MMNDASRPLLSLVIPAFNEEMQISDTMSALSKFIEQEYPHSEIIIADDGSADATCEKIRVWIAGYKGSLSFNLISIGIHKGKGYAVRAGILAAKGEFRIFMDADLPFDMEIIKDMMALHEQGCQIIIGNRNDNRSILPSIKPVRLAAGRVYSLLVQVVTSSGISDTQCGVKGFSADAAKSIFSRVTVEGFGFDVEALYIAKKLGYKIQRIPVKMVSNRPESRVRLIHDSIEMFGNLIQIRENDCKGMYR